MRLPAPRHPVLEDLEPRILYSADNPVALVAALHDAPASEQVAIAAPTQVTAASELVFIDARVADKETLLADIAAQAVAGRPIEAIVLDADRDGIDQIGEALAARHDITAVHLISHAAEGMALAGNSWLDANTLLTRADDIAAWGAHLARGADLLLYGCDVGAGGDGAALVDGLAALTGANVAASDDATGGSSFGGDWQLEVTSGAIEAGSAIDASGQLLWNHALATYVVTNTDDSGAGSLRQAIIEANANPGADTISFNIAGAGLHTIAPTAALPTITDTVTIDGYTQAGSSVSTAAVGTNAVLTIELNGASWSGNGLTLAAGSDGSTIRGLVLNQLSSAIVVASSSNVIAGNFIGSDASGYGALDNNVGIEVVGGTGSRIGGSALADRNLITANDYVEVLVTNAVGTQIVGNAIGTDASATAVISAAYVGIDVQSGAVGTQIIGNTIGGTQLAGVSVDGGAPDGQAAILGNTIFGPQAMAIDLRLDGVTANDAGDLDAGPNGLQNTPVLASASTTGSSVIVAGTLNSDANSFHRIEFFASSADNASGHGDAQRYLGFVNVATDGAGNASFATTLSGTVAVGEIVTASATRATSAAYAAFTATSELAANVTTVQANRAPVLTPIAPTLATITEGQTSNAGQTVASFVGASITDLDSGALQGIAITAINSGNGSWQFSTDGGSTWTVVGTVSDTAALLLRATDRVRFVPNAVAGTSASLTYRAWDQTAGSAAARVDTSTTGGTSAFSVASDIATIAVSSINDAPTLGDSSGLLVVAQSPAANDGSFAVAVQPDGRIVTTGYANGANAFLITRHNADGSLDTSFGSGGYATVFNAASRADALVLLPNGQILIAGYTTNPGTGTDFAVARLNENGTLDTSFGTGGTASVSFNNGGQDRGHALLVQADGKIVLGGNATSSGNPALALTRLNADGTLDTGFGIGGRIVRAIGTTDQVWGLAQQADGKIVVAGNVTQAGTTNTVLLRYTSAGVLDMTFNGTGYVVTNVAAGANDSANALLMQPDGKLVLVGDAADNVMVLRFTAAGVPDTTFNGTGQLTVDLGGADIGLGVALQPDGRLLVTGRGGAGGDVALVRVTSNGLLDTSFGAGTGFVLRDAGGVDTGRGVALQADGRIVVAGVTTLSGGNDNGFLARFGSDGQPDGTLGGTLTRGAAYVENGSAVVIDANAVVFDAELAATNYGGATLTIARSGGADAQDVFSASGSLSALIPGAALVYGGVTIGTVTTNHNGTLVLTFGTSATQALVNRTLQSIAYANDSEAPPASVVLAWSFSDGNAGAQGSGGALAAGANTTVTITAVNDAPVITSANTVSVAEGQLTATTVTSTDVDGGAPVYSIAGGADAARFSIDASTGLLSFVVAPDYENPTDADADNVYQVTVQVSDGSATAQQQLAVSVTDVSSALVVTTDADTNDAGIVAGAAYTVEWLNAHPGADGAISLREAIIAANNTPGADTISFDIAGTGLHTITLVSALPIVTDTITIDGYTQAGSSVNTAPIGTNAVLTIELNGAAASGADGLRLDTGSDGSTIRGLVIDRFASGNGIAIGSNANVVAGNFIGTSADGESVRSNHVGVINYAGSGSRIGGSALADRNLIAGNTYTEILEFGTSAGYIYGNYIGTDASGGLVFGNAYDAVAAYNSGFGVQLGGIAPGQRNVIAGSITGVAYDGSGGGSMAILGNSIYGGSSRIGNVASVGAAVLAGASSDGVQTTASGTLDLSPNAFYRVEFFDNAALSQRYLGFVNVATDASGHADFTAVLSASVPAGSSIGATVSTATDASYSAFTVTSQFAADVIVPDNPPVIDSSPRFTIDENATVVGVVTAVDLNTPPSGLSYSIVGGADAARFAIDAATGTLRFVVPPDFENPADTDGDNVYRLVVQVSDGALSSTQAIDVSVADVNEVPVLTPIAPTLNAITEDDIGNTGQTVASFIGASIANADAGAPQGIAINATNSGNGAWQYSTDGGTTWAATGAVSDASPLLLRAIDRLRFVPDTRNATTGAVTYRAWEQSGTGAVFSTATDTATISVGAVNDAPVITSGAAFSSVESRTAVGVVTSSDVDGGAPSYRIDGGDDAARFAIDARTGALRFVTAPDFEAPSDADGDNVYLVSVRVDDGLGGVATQSIAVTVTDVNEAPTITSNGGGASAAIDQDGTTTRVTQVVASDADRTASTLVYSIGGGADAARFVIDPQTGVLSFVVAPALDATPAAAGGRSYDVIVVASDGALKATQRLTIVADWAMTIPVTPTIPGDTEMSTHSTESTPSTSPTTPASESAKSNTTAATTTTTTKAASSAATPATPAAIVQMVREPEGAAGYAPDTRIAIASQSEPTRSPAAPIRTLVLPATVAAPRRDEEAARDPVDASPATVSTAAAAESAAGARDASIAPAPTLDLPSDGGHAMAHASVQVGIAVSVGLVGWVARGASLAASVLVATPAWSSYDLLPVLRRRDEDADWGDDARDPEAAPRSGGATRDANRTGRRDRRTLELTR